jgi:hypothetical protein
MVFNMSTIEKDALAKNLGKEKERDVTVKLSRDLEVEKGERIYSIIYLLFDSTIALGQLFT